MYSNSTNNSTSGQVKTKFTMFHEEIFKLFVKPGEIIEVRIIATYGGKNSIGYFDNFESFKTNVQREVSKQQGNIYFSLQVIDPRLIGRAFNKLKYGGSGTSDNSVKAYRWIPIDIDPERPAGVSSSDRELKEAISLRNVICEWIRDTTEYKQLMTAVSGNGGHILIRLPKDQPVSKESKTFIKSFLEEVYENFSTENIKVDTTVFNPSRIWKLYGSIAKKGDEVPGNKYREALRHRQAYIDGIWGLL